MSIDTSLIKTYLEKNLPDALKPQVDQFVPLLKNNIKTICQEWLKRVQEEAGKDPQTVFKGRLLDKNKLYDVFKESTLPRVWCYDREGIELVCRIFEDKFQITTFPKVFFSCQSHFENSFMNVLPKGDFYDVDFMWTPSNPHVRTGAAKNFSPEILEYLEKNLPPHLSESADEFLPLVTSRIDEICQRWLERVKEQAEPAPYCIFKAKLLTTDRIYDTFDESTLEGVDFFDKEGGELIMKIFLSRFEIYATPVETFPLYENTNTLLNILPEPVMADMEFTWRPTNPHIYTKEIIETPDVSAEISEDIASA